MDKAIKLNFVLDHALKEYRIPFFKQLAEKNYAITVVHPGKKLNDLSFIKQKTSKIKWQINGLEYRKTPRVERDSIVIYMQNLHVVNFWLMTLNPFNKNKLIHWGIGVSSAKGISPEKDKMSKLRDLIATYCDAIVLYSDFPKKLFSNKNQKKLFIAHNTIENNLKLDLSNELKDSFLFIGSLNKRKGLEVLIDSFSEYLQKFQPTNIHKLVIIGDGELMNELVNKVNDLNISKSVVFVGNVQEQSKKIKYFKNAAASISPFQAGLSVLESFSFGLPFITYENAISGGEHLNIINGENGYLVNSKKELVEKMKTLDTDREHVKQLGHNAFNYYHSKRRMQDMVNVFDGAFKFVMKEKA